MGVNVPLATQGTETTLVPLFRGGVSNHWSLNQDAWEPDDRPALQFKNDTSYTRGGHVLKFGGEYRWSANNRTAGNCNDPCFNFNGQYTGHPLGDFLIGRSSSLEQFSVRYNKGRAQAFATYLQDDWQVRPDVTLSMGVRWEPFIAFYEVDQPQPVFRPGEKSTMFPNAPLGLLYAGDPGVPRGGHPTNWANIAPRMAVAWRLNPKTSLRTAYGIFHDTARFFHYPKTLVFTPPYSISRTTNDVQFSDPYKNAPNRIRITPPASSAEYATYQYQLPVRVTSYPDDFSGGYSQQWNVNLQRDLGADLVVSAAYVGTRASDLATSRQINSPVLGAGCHAGESSTTAAVPAIRKHPELRSDRPIRIPRHAVEREQAIQPRIFRSGQLHLQQGSRQRERRRRVLTTGPERSDGYVGSGKQRPAASAGDLGVVGITVAAGPSGKSRAWRLAAQQHHYACRGHAVHGQHRSRYAAELPVGACQCVRRSNVRSESIAGRAHRQVLRAIGFLDPCGRHEGEHASQIPDRSWIEERGPLDVQEFTLQRNFRVQVRIEAFNAFNFVNLGNPQGNITSATVGQILSAGDARVMQLGLRMTF